MKYFEEWNSEIGMLTLREENEKLTGLYFGKADTESFGKREETALLKQVKQELKQYFEGNRRTFTFPYFAEGTPFQKRVWAELEKIPYGKTASYKELAEAVDCPKGFRAVGMANHANPIPIVIPCHRVIASDGSLGGYGGGISLKKKLLHLEENI